MDAETAAVAVTTVRLPSDLRDVLARAASQNQRSVSAEIVKRLADSVSADDLSSTVSDLTKRATQLRNEIAHAPAVKDADGTYSGGRQSAYEALLLSLFAQMPPERQLALLTLLRS